MSKIIHVTTVARARTFRALFPGPVRICFIDRDGKRPKLSELVREARPQPLRDYRELEAELEAQETKQPHEVHRDMVSAVRRHVEPSHQCRRWAMLAKESIFKAQDTVWDVREPLQSKFRKRLAKIRRELEALDRDAYREGNEQ